MGAFRPWRRAAAAACVAGALSGCASYRPLPLDTRAPLRHRVSDLQHPGLALRLPLTVPAVALLAVENDPDLRAARAERGVAQAEVVQAGILPNPSVTGSLLPVLSGPGVAPAWTAGLSEDLRSLVTLTARKQAARATAGQVNASLLWQEWQVAGKASLLAVDIMEGGAQLRLLEQTRALLAERYNLTRRAVAQGNADLSTLSPDLAALDDTRRQIGDLDRQQQARRHELDALLGLAPDAVLPLAPAPDLPPVDPAAVERMLPALADRRPDLIALRLGYAAQDARLRAAILAQFPALTIGITGGSDTSNVRTFGPQVTLDLPVFDRNQGNIRIARATRRQLHDAFSARLAAATGEIQAMLADMALLQRQISTARGQLAATEAITREAEAAFRAGNLTERAYVDFVTARAAQRQQVLGWRQSLLEQRVGLATLIGAGMPTADLATKGGGPV
ncbi:MAG TPA: TolC family protein [Acetobacteraceae bacterium]|nr:TolC family protein [Acetobacteraceae bacterium]